MSEDWRNLDGSIDYRDYLSSSEWRRWRESYWKRHPDGACARCGVTLSVHRSRYGQRLHLHHLSYRNIGQEADDDVEPICKPCHDAEHSGESSVETLMEALSDAKSSPDFLNRVNNFNPTITYLRKFEERQENRTAIEYWHQALHKIDDARKTITAMDDESSWNALNKLQFLEEFARFCLNDSLIQSDAASSAENRSDGQ